MKEVPLRQVRILKAIGVRVFGGGPVNFLGYDLLIDALLGYNQRGSPRGEVGKLIEGANRSGIPILALDTPTGLDPDTGIPHEPCIRATQTLTLGLPKKGLCVKESKRFVGKLFLADISVPRRLYREFGLKHALFSSNSIIELK
jgi:NAD(P)H-hydrate epimerase